MAQMSPDRAKLRIYVALLGLCCGTEIAGLCFFLPSNPEVTIYVAQQSHNKAATKPPQCHMCLSQGPYAWLRHALERLPQVILVEDCEALIPWSCSLTSPR